jgi:hypothetical protein
MLFETPPNLQGGRIGHKEECKLASNNRTTKISRVLYKPISNVGNVKVLVVTLLTKVLGFPRE